MTTLIDPNDPQYFTQTCGKPYDNHHYKIIDPSGDFIIVQNYEEAKWVWYNTPRDALSHIEVIDKKAKPKGFL